MVAGVGLGCDEEDEEDEEDDADAASCAGVESLRLRSLSWLELMISSWKSWFAFRSCIVR